MDLRHLQPDSQSNVILTVGSKGVFPALLVIFFMSCFSFLPQHLPPPPHLFSLHTQEQIFFLLPPQYCIILVLRGKMELRGQKFSQKKMINLWQITKCYPANWRRCKAEPSGSLSSLPLNRCHISKSACVFHQNWEPMDHRLGNISRVGGTGGRKLESLLDTAFCGDLLPICCFPCS